MDRPDGILDAQVDQLAEEALLELGIAFCDEPDEYAEQCNYAGCYPWLAHPVCTHPQDATLQTVVRDGRMLPGDEEFSG